MSQIQKNLPKIGSLPGTLKYTGERTDTKSKIEVISYNDDHFKQKNVTSVDDLSMTKDNNIWINVYGLNKPKEIEIIGERLGIDSLILEDILNVGQRPKLEIQENKMFLVMKMLTFDEENTKIKQEQISFILYKNILIVFQEYEGDVFDPIRERIRNKRGMIRGKNIDYLLYCLLDLIIDEHFFVLSKIEEKILGIEEKIIQNVNNQLLQNIYKLRKELSVLKTSVWPIKEIIHGILREEEIIDADIKKYFRDSYDHIHQVMDFILVYREMISGLFDTYLSNTSNKMNQIMTTLTIFSAIFIPLTFLAGVYGMNFEYIPELSFKLAYPLFWAVCVSIAFTMYAFFKRKKWL